MDARTAPARPLAEENGQSAEHDEYEISATTSLNDQRPRALKHDDTFGVFDRSGDVIAEVGSSEGLYHRDTRHLSHFYLTINGGIRPILLSSSLRDDNSVLNCDLTNPDLPGQGDLPKLANDLVHIRRTRFIHDGSMFERLRLTNYDHRPHTITLEMHFASDFKDLFEVRGAVRAHRGEMLVPVVREGQVVLAYAGLDGQTRSTTLNFDPPPDRLTASSAVFRLDVPPRKGRTLTLQVGCNRPEAQSEPLRHRLIRCYRDARSDLRLASSRAASIASSHEMFNQAIRRCVADTYMLLTETEYGPFPYAGIPWYSTVFGRDALITALETLWLDPEIARGVLGYLAAHQATEFDAKADAEPGKILHEVRNGEMANLGEVPFRRYYGSIDSTPLFVMLAGAYLQRTDDIVTIEQLWPNVTAALEWIENHGDRDGDGYVEYGRHAHEGLINQGWKDSHDSVFHADGRIAKGPIALAEVQAYVFGAWTAGAAMLERLGRSDEALAYRARARDLAQRFDEDFFDEELGTYVLALDGEKRPCRVRSSNAGQVLLTGLARNRRARRVVETLMAGASFSGWGIRTIPAGEARYNPMSYHNGSIWPHDNALIASGFARYGFRREAAQILEGLLAASTYVDQRRLPELFCGFGRRPANGPTFYPVSCIPQAWSAAAPLSLIQSCLGLSIDGHAQRIEFDRPTLPPFLDELRLCKLRVGHAWADIALRRSGRDVLVEVTEREGDLRVVSYL